jgi:hypothetical protein
MNNRASGKVVKPFDVKPALLVPGPVRDDRVDEAGDHDAVHDVGAKVATFRQSSCCKQSSNMLLLPINEEILMHKSSNV